MGNIVFKIASHLGVVFTFVLLNLIIAFLFLVPYTFYILICPKISKKFLSILLLLLTISTSLLLVIVWCMLFGGYSIILPCLYLFIIVLVVKS